MRGNGENSASSRIRVLEHAVGDDSLAPSSLPSGEIEACALSWVKQGGQPCRVGLPSAQIALWGVHPRIVERTSLSQLRLLGIDLTRLNGEP